MHRQGKKLSGGRVAFRLRSEEHTCELQSLAYLVCRLLLEKKKKTLIIKILQPGLDRELHITIFVRLDSFSRNLFLSNHKLLLLLRTIDSSAGLMYIC